MSFVDKLGCKSPSFNKEQIYTKIQRQDINKDKMIETLKDFDRNVKVNFKQIYADPLIGLKKYAESYTYLGPSIDKNGNPVTGLTEDKLVKTPKGQNSSVPGTRKALEKELDLAEGTLKPTSRFWLSYAIKVEGEVIELTLTDPYDLLKYLFAQAQSIVANSIAESKVTPNVEFVLYSEEQEASQRNVSRSALKKAYLLAEELDLETKIKILAIYGFLADATRPSVITDKIDEYLENNPQRFLDIANDSFLGAKALLTRCLSMGIVTMFEGKIMHGEIILGYEQDEAAKVLAKDTTLINLLKAKLSGDAGAIQEATDKKNTKK